MSKPTVRGNVLIVDDEVELMRALCESLTDEGFVTQGLSDPALAIDAIRDGDYDILLSDLMMPGTNGIELLRKCTDLDPALVGVIMTGQGTIQTAVEAMKAGAFDYILKPFRLQNILPVLDRAMEVRRLRLLGRRRQAGADGPDRLIGDDPARGDEAVGHRARELLLHHRFGEAGEALGLRLAHADDRQQPRRREHPDTAHQRQDDQGAPTRPADLAPVHDHDHHTRSKRETDEQHRERLRSTGIGMTRKDRHRAKTARGQPNVERAKHAL